MELPVKTNREPPRKRHCPGLQSGRWQDALDGKSNYNEALTVQLVGKPMDCPANAVAKRQPAVRCPDSEICFGMLIDIPIKAATDQAIACDDTNTPAYLTPHKKLRRAADGAIIGRLCGQYARSLPTLAAEDGVRLEFSCSLRPEIRVNRENARCDILYAAATIYGPDSLSGDMAAFMKRCGYFLQEPVGCSRNLPYKNPQCLAPLEGGASMTFDLSVHSRHCATDLTPSSTDFLDKIAIDSTEEIPWADAPSALATKLHPHQHQALTFFQRKERGFNTDGHGHEMWEIRPNPVKPRFINTITGMEEQDPPRKFRGGILADEMGLGKTLSMIALITSDKERSVAIPHTPVPRPEYRLQTARFGIKSTLVIVPPSLLATWEDQFLLHLVPQTITWMKHHEKHRISLYTVTNPPDIILTTYQTVVSEFKKPARGQPSLFSFQWHRIILDEAHRIRNWKSATAQATSALSATCRWAITGTPIQNGLQDLVGLLKFIQAYPYDNERRFETDIINLWREDRAPEAIERIRKLVNCVMVRRQKTVIELPPRRNNIFRIELNKDERLRYQMFERPFMKTIQGNEGLAQYPTVLQQINKLRMICNLGVAFIDPGDFDLVQMPVSPVDDALAGFKFEEPTSAVVHEQTDDPIPGDDSMSDQDTPEDVEMAEGDKLIDDDEISGNEEMAVLDDMFVDEEGNPTTYEESICPDLVTTRLTTEGSCCSHCKKHLEPPDPSSKVIAFETYPHYATCLNLYCGDCATNLPGLDIQCECGLSNICLLRPILPNMMQSHYLRYGQCPPATNLSSTMQISSKVKAVISNIRKHIDEKSVVFTYWRSSLDMVQEALIDMGIQFVRLDGTFSHEARKNSLEAFRNDENMKVALLTISCGAVGLDLTAASRVHLLEPQWNPTVEDQAFARVHRLGQTRSVTTNRYIVRDSFEEHVIEVRDRKKILSELLLAKEKPMDEKMSYGQFQRFLSLLRR